MESRIKLLLLIRRLSFGGAERQLVNLAMGLAKRGHKVVIVTYYPNGELEQQCIGLNLEIICLEKKGRWDLLGYIIRLARCINASKPDICYSFSSSTNVILYFATSLTNPKPKLIWRIATSFIDYSKYDWTARAVVAIERSISKSKRIAWVISNSFAGADFAVENGFRRDSIKVIPNGVAVPMASACPPNLKLLRDSLGLPIESPLIGLVGRIDPMKGHSISLDAFSILKSRGRFFRAVFIGNGDSGLRLRLEEKAIRLGLAEFVYWSPAVSDIGSVYQALDLVICPSLGEGFPNVLAESMAHSTLAVASDVGDNGLIVQGKSFLFPSGDSRALADRVDFLINLQQSDSDRLRRNGKTKIKNQFSIQNYVDRTEECLLGLL